MQKKRSFVNKAGGGRAVFGKKEKKRLLQLVFCICLFMVILLGRGNELFQEKQAGDKLLQMVQENTDFTAAFSALGDSLSAGESVLRGVQTLLSDLFGVRDEDDSASKRIVVAVGPAYENALRKMTAPVSADSMMLPLSIKPVETVMPEDSETEDLPEDEVSAEIQEQQPPVVENEPEADIPEVPTYTGPELPANATMEYLVLELDTTQMPVKGEISSGFGYRDHPITEAHSFHAGIDIAADIGTPILAFADGTVEFIGESKKYGLYVQLDHGSGVKTFYCHCSELLYGKGKAVKAGETIALVGDTGDTTGSHLHLELKKDGILLNPVYYIGSAS